MIAVVIPTLDTPAPLARLLSELPDFVAAYVVDDGSREPIVAPVRVLRHETNRGYGAAQKTGYAAALAEGADRIVMLHGDGQYNTEDTLALAALLDHADAAIGSRFLADPSVIPPWRRWGNRGLTGLANARFGRDHTDLHSGARAFRASTLRKLPLASYSDDFLFDQEVLCGLFREGMTVLEGPVRTHYGDGARSISLRRSVRYGLGCLGVILGP